LPYGLDQCKILVYILSAWYIDDSRFGVTHNPVALRTGSMYILSEWRIDDSRFGLTHNPVALRTGSM